MNKYLYSIILLPIIGFSQQNLTLEDCYNAAINNYPLAKQIELASQKQGFEIESLSKNKLPKIDFNAQATYQSEVTKFPLSLPNISVEPLNKDQYRTTIDVLQTVYNGDFTDKNIQLKKAQTQTQQQQIRINLYQLKPKINQYFFSVLLLQEKRALLLEKQKLLNVKIAEVKTAVKYGTVLAASEQVLQAESLKIEQQLVDNQYEKMKNIHNLAQLTQTNIDVNAQLIAPNFSNSEKTELRPELEYYNLKNKEIEFSKQIINASKLPKVNAFAQLGYGNPGLNMLKNSFELFYITGIKATWNIFDWNKSKKEQQALSIVNDMITNEKEVFKVNQEAQLQELRDEIEKLNTIIKTDNEIVNLRNSIVKTADAQFKYGVITSSEFITELTQLFEAKNIQKTHQVQLYLNQSNYNIIKGN